MNKTFAELGYNVGDMVRCVETTNGLYKIGEVLTLSDSSGYLRHVSAGRNVDGSLASWELVSRAGSTVTAYDEYLIWGDMTPEAQGALLLAFHNKATIQFYCYDEWTDIQDPSFTSHDKYRVKPADPVVVTHEIYGSNELFWGYLTNEDDTHKMTYNTIDGVIDCASVKMMEIDKP